MRAARLIVALGLLAGGAGTAAADPVWLALSIGQEVGAASDVRLRYAERDARRMHDVMTTLGDVASSRAYLVSNASADAVRQTLKEIRGRTSELVAAGHQPILLVYVSSHADGAGLRLGSSVLPHWELRSLVSSIPAQVRLLVIDACASGALIRRKGAAVEEPFALPGASLEGQVILTATGPAEPAQEWDALGGALFTHNLVSAMRGAGDADGDGDVTLFEAYSYAYERTLAQSTTALLGPQHPAHEIELRGNGDLVLTHPARRGSTLVLGRGMVGRYVISTEDGGELVLEADKRRRAVMRLALPPGRYIVRKPEGRFVRVGVVTVRAGAATVLHDGALERVAAFEVGRRGPVVPRDRALEATFATATGTVEGQAATIRVGAAYRRGLGPLELSAGAAVAVADLDGRAIEGRQLELWGDLGARWRYPLGWILPYVGARAGAAAIRQDLDDARGGATPARHGVAFEAMGALGAEVDVSERLVLRVEGATGWVVPRLSGGLEARRASGLATALGWRW